MGGVLKGGAYLSADDVEEFQRLLSYAEINTNLEEYAKDLRRAIEFIEGAIRRGSHARPGGLR